MGAVAGTGGMGERHPSPHTPKPWADTKEVGGNSPALPGGSCRQAGRRAAGLWWGRLWNVQPRSPPEAPPHPVGAYMCGGSGSLGSDFITLEEGRGSSLQEVALGGLQEAGGAQRGQ